MRGDGCRQRTRPKWRMLQPVAQDFVGSGISTRRSSPPPCSNSYPLGTLDESKAPFSVPPYVPNRYSSAVGVPVTKNCTSPGINVQFAPDLQQIDGVGTAV